MWKNISISWTERFNRGLSPPPTLYCGTFIIIIIIHVAYTSNVTILDPHYPGPLLLVACPSLK